MDNSENKLELAKCCGFCKYIINNRGFSTCSHSKTNYVTQFNICSLFEIDKNAVKKFNENNDNFRYSS